MTRLLEIHSQAHLHPTSTWIHITLLSLGISHLNLGPAAHFLKFPKSSLGALVWFKATTDPVPVAHSNLDFVPGCVSYPACSPLRGVWALERRLEPSSAPPPPATGGPVSFIRSLHGHHLSALRYHTGLSNITALHNCGIDVTFSGVEFLTIKH